MVYTLCETKGILMIQKLLQKASETTHVLTITQLTVLSCSLRERKCLL